MLSRLLVSLTLYRSLSALSVQSIRKPLSLVSSRAYIRPTLKLMATEKDVVKFTHLSKNQFAVLRQAATEPAGYSENTPGELEFELKESKGSKLPKDGIFECQACGAALYKAETKFDSGCGWPAFYAGIDGAVKEKPDADGRRIEIVCSKCDSHLGHTFKGEGFPTPTNERHCVNGICLMYKDNVN